MDGSREDHWSGVDEDGDDKNKIHSLGWYV